MDRKKANITLKTISHPANCPPDAIELMTEGTLSSTEKDGVECWEISYDDTEATGLIGSTTTVRCFGDALASMERDGDASSLLIIEKDKKHHCHYGTPFGSMIMGIYTNKIENKMTENGGRIYLNYTIDIDSMLVTSNEVMLEVKIV